MTFLFYILVFVLSSSIVSFLTVVGYDFPKIEIMRRSKCNNCQKQLKWLELFPVIGYLFLKGRCRNCHKRISWIYPTTELFGAIFVILAIYLEKNIYLFAPIFIMITLLAFMDFYHGFIYPIFYLLSIPSFILFIVFHHKIYLITGIITYLILLCMYRFSKGIGMGDIEVLTILALFFGYTSILNIILLACIMCILHHLINKKRSFRFIPYITIATGIIFLIS
ncbi:hypothetical protein BTM29_00880 [Companilactobacillus allii]|uniref:Uncharacterized protein n=1 Tax=Companilactobacillus allii TaxID=1847728 RepID=A0A1P8PZZ7_9LACO|nr:hypothetical protein BTM29_00880 [Companilactobacillus allii]